MPEKHRDYPSTPEILTGISDRLDRLIQLLEEIPRGFIYGAVEPIGTTVSAETIDPSDVEPPKQKRRRK